MRYYTSIRRKVGKRPVWRDDYGAFRVGHCGDTIQMLDDLKIPDRAY